MRIVGGIWAERRLISPGRRVRPTHEFVRVMWMDHLAAELPGARVVDLFAGSGALGLEALSRGAAAVDFVESGAEALHALKGNVAGARLKPLRRGQAPSEARKSARIFKRDAIQFASRLSANAYDFAFADPPYGSRKLDRVIEAWQRTAFARVLVVEFPRDHPTPVPEGVHEMTYEETVVRVFRAPGEPQSS